MADAENNGSGVPFRERLTRPFRVFFQDGFIATWREHQLFSVVSLSILGVAATTGIWWFGLRDSSVTTAKGDGPESNNRVAASPRENLDEVASQLRMDETQWRRRQEEGQRQEEIALAKYRLACVRQLADRTQEAIDACRDVTVEWAEDMKDFKTTLVDWSEPSNHALLGQIDMLLDMDTPSKSEADDLQEQHEVLTTPLKRANSTGEVTSISSSLESKIEELAVTARDMRDLYRRRRAMLRAIRGRVQPGSQEKVSDIHSALEDYRTELAGKQQARLDEHLAEVRQENEALLRKVEEEVENAREAAEREAVEAAGRIEAKRIAGEARRKEALQAVEDAEAQLKADREKLEREFQMDLPKIKHYLVAFITPDNHHPVKGVTIEKIPYPFSHLESQGALGETEKGLRRLGHIGSREAGARPRGPIADMYNLQMEHLSADQREAIVMAQQLLRKYGLLMVKKKMLLP